MTGNMNTQAQHYCYKMGE